MATLDFEGYMLADSLATNISNVYTQWKQSRSDWESGAEEVRNYVFATDTRSTSNSALPWKNSTTIPKLTQIRDNLHANYMAALFPTEDWLSWVAEDETTVAKEKRVIIEQFMKNRLRESGFRATVEQLVLDYIDYGNCFAGVTFVRETIIDEEGKEKAGYVGPKLYRISPYDIVINPAAESFEKSPKITRILKSVGELEQDVKHNREMEYSQEILDHIKEKRKNFSKLGTYDKRKVNGFRIDGFGNIDSYFNSGMVEILEFEGTMYDATEGVLYEDHIITVVDRSKVIRAVPRKAWTGMGYKAHVGWRKRPDNLYAQGPLDNLVGMQYRIDHLENLRADVFDQIAFPRWKIRGEVEDFSDQPGERIYVGEEGDVTAINPDVTALNADNQIQMLEMRMEQYAGAPKEAMGIRTPGEKTMFEVQQLQNAASRIFQNKISQFESQFLEPLINMMFEVAKRHMPAESTLDRIVDSDSGVISFIKITADDVKGSGKLYPRGARHFAAQAQLVQNLNNMYNSALAQDQGVMVHFSGKEIAKMLVEVLGFDQYNLYNENIRITENQETTRLANAANEIVETENATDITSLDDGSMDEELPPA